MKNMELLNSGGGDLLKRIMHEKKNLIAQRLIPDKKDAHKYPINNFPFHLPKDWCWCYLSDVSFIQEGPGIRKHQYKDSGIQFLTVTNILEDEVDLEKSKKYISNDEYEKTYKHFTLNRGDIVTACSGGSWGKSAIYDLDNQIILNTSTLRLRFYGDLSIAKYLYYYTKTSFFKKSLSSYTTGLQPNYGYYHYSRIMFPLCSLSEQERIVGILDSAFAKIEAMRANAEQNLQNAKDLFQASIDKAYAVPTESKPISSVAKVVNGYAFSSDDFKPTNTIKSIKITNVGVGEFIEESENYLPTKYADDLKDVQVSNGDIVIALTRTIISAGLKVAIVPNSYNGALVNQRVAALVPFDSVMSRKYLYNFLLTTKVKNYVLDHVNTLMQPNLSITDLKNMDVPYLPYAEQEIAANNIDALSERCRAMEENYRQILAACNDLKQALLKKAFNGEL